MCRIIFYVLARAKLIVWDEAPLAQKHSYGTLDRPIERHYGYPTTIWWQGHCLGWGATSHTFWDLNDHTHTCNTHTHTIIRPIIRNGYFGGVWMTNMKLMDFIFLLPLLFTIWLIDGTKIFHLLWLLLLPATFQKIKLSYTHKKQKSFLQISMRLLPKGPRANCAGGCQVSPIMESWVRYSQRWMGQSLK